MIEIAVIEVIPKALTCSSFSSNSSDVGTFLKPAFCAILWLTPQIPETPTERVLMHRQTMIDTQSENLQIIIHQNVKKWYERKSEI